MTSHVRITPGDIAAPKTGRLCRDCFVEQFFTDRICHTPTSMLSVEAINASGHCERCGGIIRPRVRPELLWDGTQPRTHLIEAYRDGKDSARNGEALRDFWELIDLGYSPGEARCFHWGYQRGLS